MDLVAIYHQKLQEKSYTVDDRQLAAIEQLQLFATQFANSQKSTSRGLLSRWLGSTPSSPEVKGVYLYGGVGRGKSFVMDIFFAAVPIEKKVRLHFHEFMLSIHQALREERGVADPLKEVAKKVADKYQLICFDEFHVSDIADAMILHQLLQYLWGNGIQFVMTSNYEPSTLYPDGLHRNRILPAIDLIYQKMTVIELDAQTDYRQLKGKKIPHYLYPLHTEHQEQINGIFQALAQGPIIEQPSLTLQGRTVTATRKSDNIIWFTFEELCVGAYSQVDYLLLAQQFSIFFLEGIPKMQASDASSARRLTWLIDVLYDHQLDLVCLAEVSMQELYREGVFANEFTRTLSRLEEMQSESYQQLQARQVVQL